MKRAFTLVEMLVVVVVLVILMSIVFRLGSIVGDRTARSKTIEKLHKIENCLSGYYAAFGSYPPVANYYKPNPYLEFDNVKRMQRETEVSSLDWKNVQPACRAQPVAARWPGDNAFKTYANMISQKMMRFAAQGKYSDASAPWMSSGFTAFSEPSEFSDWENPNFQECAIFQFGLMSYLLPRYQLMGMNLSQEFIRALGTCKQWTANNRFAANQDNGELFTSWEDQLGGGTNVKGGNSGSSGRSKEYQRNLIERIPSEAVTARWMPNLDRLLGREHGDLVFYGVTVAENGSAFGHYVINADCEPRNIETYKGTGSNYSVLDAVSVADGWGFEIYYYSEPPYQSYRLWSAGPPEADHESKTFLPGYPLDKLKSDKDRKLAAQWMADDIVFMNH